MLKSFQQKQLKHFLIDIYLMISVMQTLCFRTKNLKYDFNLIYVSHCLIHCKTHRLRHSNHLMYFSNYY